MRNRRERNFSINFNSVRTFSLNAFVTIETFNPHLYPELKCEPLLTETRNSTALKIRFHHNFTLIATKL